MEVAGEIIQLQCIVHERLVLIS